VDGGVWPEHPSYSDRTGSNANAVDGKLAYQQIPGWHGKCTPGEAFTAAQCNQKLIGAQYFLEGRLANIPIPEYEFLSARDWGGHGSHTSSTAGGNHGVQATGEAAAFPPISGMAPRARIAAYKTSYYDLGQATGVSITSDLAAAIDQAVADGVDVINLSIGGTSTNFLNAVQVAFLGAADAGVFVAAAAGNSGPTAGTVAHPSPWITTVAAGTHDRTGSGSVALGNGTSHAGASLAGATVSGPFVDSTAVGLDNDPQPGTPEAPNPVPFATRVALCFSGHLDPAKAAGKIVLCDRGSNARVDKSLAVKMANGLGMVLVNVAPTIGVAADFHFVPSVHVENTSRAALKAYAATAGATATIAAFTPATVAAPFNASFSSRGPLAAAGGDLLKPDVTAPGQDVLAAVAPPGNFGRLFDMYSGTSMASPHVAGLGALLKQRHPDWSPMMIKSALMTTATPLLGTAANTTPFVQGAGHVSPNAAADPGLVYDSGFNEWLAFLCGTGQLVAAYCPGIRIDPSDLNVPSIAIGDLLATQTVTRRVTNVDDSAATYNVSVSAPPGIGVSVNPATLNVGPGETKAYTVTFNTLSTATRNAYAFGSITWSDDAHNVRIPLAIRPVALLAPAAVSGTGASGSLSYDVKFGYAGGFAARPHGLVPAVATEASVVDDPANSFSPTGQGVTAHTVVIPAGTRLARFSLFDEFTDGEDDLDLYVFNSANVQVGTSGGGTSAEEVTLSNPPAGTYTVYVHGWQTDGPDANYTLFTWLLGEAAAGNLTVSGPSAATIGATASIGVTWSGLTPGLKYLGTVTHHATATPAGYTDQLLGSVVVRIDP
jgi:subtilase family protein/fibronectin type III domain protein/PA domain-containing protein/pre-peptidase